MEQRRLWSGRRFPLNLSLVGGISSRCSCGQNPVNGHATLHGFLWKKKFFTFSSWIWRHRTSTRSSRLPCAFLRGTASADAAECLPNHESWRRNFYPCFKSQEIIGQVFSGIGTVQWTQSSLPQNSRKSNTLVCLLCCCCVSMSSCS